MTPSAPGADPVPFRRRGHGASQELPAGAAPPTASGSGRVSRLARLMALALRAEEFDIARDALLDVQCRRRELDRSLRVAELDGDVVLRAIDPAQLVDDSWPPLSLTSLFLLG